MVVKAKKIVKDEYDGKKLGAEECKVCELFVRKNNLMQKRIAVINNNNRL